MCAVEFIFDMFFFKSREAIVFCIFKKRIGEKIDLLEYQVSIKKQGVGGGFTTQNQNAELKKKEKKQRLNI